MTQQLTITVKASVSFALRCSFRLGIGLVFWMLTATAEANIIQNPNFTFVGTGTTSDDADVPNWTLPQNESNLTVSDPQVIFDFTHEYYQVQTGTGAGGPGAMTPTLSLFQQVTISAQGTATLSMVASHRNDNVNTNGGVFIRFYTGHVGAGATGFNGLTPITPDTAVAPTLSGALQTFSNTYLDLVPGDYTVRVGGFRNSGQTFQAGISEVFLGVVVPEPSTGLLLGFGLFGLVMRRKTRLKVEG